MTVSGLYNVFTKQVLREGRIPFDIAEFKLKHYARIHVSLVFRAEINGRNLKAHIVKMNLAGFDLGNPFSVNFVLVGTLVAVNLYSVQMKFTCKCFVCQIVDVKILRMEFTQRIHRIRSESANLAVVQCNV